LFLAFPLTDLFFLTSTRIGFLSILTFFFFFLIFTGLPKISCVFTPPPPKTPRPVFTGLKSGKSSIFGPFGGGGGGGRIISSRLILSLLISSSSLSIGD
jgi:hypothetical protein